ncbi:unnamed protein product [Rhodiola kirilowii]
MWSVTLLFDKLFKAEDGSDSGLDTDRSQSSEICSCSNRQSSSDVNHETVIPSSCSIDVPHYNQQSSWDCGLACILMVLNTVGTSDCNIRDLKDLCNINSIWTVDLAYLLQKFSIQFSYFTVTLGANPTYSAEKFYMDQFSEDLVRVDMLFQNASKAGIDIQCRSISEKEVSMFILSGKYVAVALVDQSKLSDSWSKDVYVSEFFGRDTAYTDVITLCLKTCVKVMVEIAHFQFFIGHYIVVCGYDTATAEFEIRDPASSRKSRMITSECLKEARQSFGTDEDLILISLEKSEDQDFLAV